MGAALQCPLEASDQFADVYDVAERGSIKSSSGLSTTTLCSLCPTVELLSLCCVCQCRIWMVLACLVGSGSVYLV